MSDANGIERCGFIDGWLHCDLEPGHDGLHADRWLGGAPTSVDASKGKNDD